MSEGRVNLEDSALARDPFTQFQRWFDEAEGAMDDREAVALATASAAGAPSVRMVLLRHHDERSFGWFTNYESRKGEELAANDRAALLWYCASQGRQVRVEGTVLRTSAERSDAYFAERERESQLGAYASAQSRPLASREELLRRLDEVRRRFADHDIPRPDWWGGYELFAARVEFWQRRDSRLHDRWCYVAEGPAWRIERQSP